MAIHLDCYRLTGARELEQLGLRDYFTPRTLWLVEWPERGGAALPEPDLTLQLRFDHEGRVVEIEPHTQAGSAWASELK